MSSPDNPARYSARRFAVGVMVCPSCLVHLPTQVDRCPSCRFTGGDTMAMFPLPLPPLQPLLDAADLWTPREQTAIRRRMNTLEKRFPQFRWAVCSIDAVDLPNPRLFGFWMLNASPLAADETTEDRAWTVLLLFNGKRGKVGVFPGYGAEPWLGDDQWQRLLDEIPGPWAKGKRGKAVLHFLEASEIALRIAWKRVRRQLKHEERHS